MCMRIKKEGGGRRTETSFSLLPARAFTVILQDKLQDMLHILRVLHLAGLDINSEGTRMSLASAYSRDILSILYIVLTDLLKFSDYTRNECIDYNRVRL